MARVAFCGVLLAATCLGAPSARAYSDPQRFGDPTSTGGGGGRYFTGSPVDGYGCDVCHQGGAEPEFWVNGLPIEEGYEPGRVYEVRVSWPPSEEVNHALHLEVVGRDGLAAGQLALLQEAEVDAAGRCGGDFDGEPAGYELFPTGRHVLGVDDCGRVSSLRFYFTAPDVSDVAVAVSMVTSDQQASAEGDGARSEQLVLRRVGEPAPGGGCAAVPGDDGAGGLSWLGLFAGLGFLWRARRRDGPQTIGT